MGNYRSHRIITMLQLNNNLNTHNLCGAPRIAIIGLVIGLFMMLAANADDCGGTNTCGSAFSHMSCIGQCCHDDFNAWCCPPDGPWQCGGTFQHDSSHCNAPKSCYCQQKPQVFRIEASDNPTTNAASGIDSKLCCSADTTCGNQIQQTFTGSTTASWEQSVTAGVELDMHEGILVEGIDAKITLSGTWSNGASATSTQSVEGTDHCNRVSDSLTFVRLSCEATEYTIPVTIHYKTCGTTYSVAGTVTSTMLDQSCSCQATECQSSCDQDSGCDGAIGNYVNMILPISTNTSIPFTPPQVRIA